MSCDFFPNLNDPVWVNGSPELGIANEHSLGLGILEEYLEENQLLQVELAN
jgi:hypothetical protein